MGNELNSDIVLGLVILIITLLALPRPQLVESVLEQISEVLGNLQLVESVLEQLSEVLGNLDGNVVQLQRLISELHRISPMADEGFQQVVSVLELIHNVLGSLVNFVGLLLLLIRVCRRI